jgi:hypothetical protein
MTMMKPDRGRGPADDDRLDGEELLVEAISALPDIEPERDLWPGIRLRIAPRRTRITFTLPQLAMAATVLVSVTAGVSWLALTPRTGTPAPEQAIQAVAEPAGAVRSDVAPANFADEQYDKAVSDLEQILRDERDSLDPRTVIVIERNLQAIDDAIRQARAALDADPANPYLNSHLADARRRKLELLRRAASLSPGGV